MNKMVESYYKQYGVGRGICAEAIKRFGNSERTHKFLYFIKNVRENCHTYNKTFNELVYDYNISQVSS